MDTKIKRKRAYLLIIFAIVIEIVGALGISFPGIGYLSAISLIAGVYLLYKDKETRPKGTVTGHSIGGIVLVVLSIFTFIIWMFVTGLNNSSTGFVRTGNFSLEDVFYLLLSLIFLILGLYSFVRASSRYQEKKP